MPCAKEYGFTIGDIESVYITPGIQFRNKYCPDGYKSMMERTVQHRILPIGLHA